VSTETEDESGFYAELAKTTGIGPAGAETEGTAAVDAPLVEEQTALEDLEDSEEEMRGHVSELIAEQADLGGNVTKQKTPNVHLNSLHAVQLGTHAELSAGGKREVKVVWGHSKIKVQADLDDRGFHRIHMDFSSICALGQRDVAEPAAHRAIVLGLCATATIEFFDMTKAIKAKGNKRATKGKWVDAKDMPVVTQVRIN
tara:strand:+ start:4730 stop:5329 length:600 start_codon:yes stop_codon:yes gene_type:complete